MCTLILFELKITIYYRIYVSGSERVAYGRIRTPSQISHKHDVLNESNRFVREFVHIHIYLYIYVYTHMFACLAVCSRGLSSLFNPTLLWPGKQAWLFGLEVLQSVTHRRTEEQSIDKIILLLLRLYTRSK